MSDEARCAPGQKETCEACGAEFRCDPMGSCWCFGETIPKEARENIEGRYERCLCQTCLRKAVDTAAHAGG